MTADSFKAYRIVAPDSFQRLGACADSGYYIAADSGFAYLCDRWGLYVIDATDPTNPHQATILTGAQTGAAWVDSGYCYYTTAGASPNSFRIADVSDPYHPAELGYIDSIASYDLFKLSYFVYLPGYYIVDVSTPSFPTTVGSHDLRWQWRLDQKSVQLQFHCCRLQRLRDHQHHRPGASGAGYAFWLERTRPMMSPQIARLPSSPTTLRE